MCSEMLCFDGDEMPFLLKLLLIVCKGYEAVVVLGRFLPRSCNIRITSFRGSISKCKLTIICNSMSIVPQALLKNQRNHCVAAVWDD